ncbi:glycosyltransferase family 4 protein [Christiangramia aquimixticola]|uniref:glycosyltransferase family 4 protein n=1 Tax=Christiangramia aquimixticola TaxID=1697558 RepID=UPI003AA8FEF5
MKNIAVVCNYTLNSTRIGGMDRFFVAYDKACKVKGFHVKWFFSGDKKFQFYDKLDIEFAFRTSVEDFFLEFQNVNKLRFEVVVTHFVELCTPFYKKIKQHGNSRIIAVDHNPRPINGFSLKKRIKNRLKGILFSKYIDLFIGVSEYTKFQIIKDYGRDVGKKTSIIYNGIETEVYKLRTQKNFGKFIVASHLRKSKGIQDLIEAVDLLNTEHRKKLQIDIYGEGPMEKELQLTVKEKALEQQFNFRGNSPNLNDIFHNYSYMLQPTYMECFSLSILESLAANVPVISTPVGGNLEVIEDGVNGFIFPPGDIELLSEIIGDILDHKKAINKPVNQLIENKFYLDKMVLDHINLLDG